ncbi:MAG: hypothetical protein L6R43_00530 [Planctomycetes bacterium]|nr:hypothetical protein [Planctomycetota bacterium]
MVDVVVAEECRVRGKEVVHKVLFGCEVEWNPQMKEQLSDFQKLAVIRASRKAFVCGANGSWEAIAGRVKDFDLFWKKHKQVLPGESIAVVVCAYSKEARKVARSHAWILTKEKRKSQLAFPK